MFFKSKTASEETINLAINTIEKLIENSAAVEALRQRLTSKLGLDIGLAFNSLDYDSNGLITKKDVRLIFKAISSKAFSILMGLRHHLKS